MSKVSWKEIEQAFEDEEPIEEKPMTYEEAREYDEWMNRKREEEEEEHLRNERPFWDDEAYYDWLSADDEWYDDSDWDGE